MQRSTLADDSIQFIGNATVLIRYAGFTLLTDPNFIHRGESVPLGYGLSTERLTDPALEIDELPALDAIVLSHYHGDHFDQVAQERLDRDLPIVTTREAADKLDGIGFRLAIALDTWATHEMRSVSGRLRITSLPAKHAPAGLSVALPDVMGSCLEFWPDDAGSAAAPSLSDPPDLRLYITGDTIMYEGVHEIAQRVPQIDVALIHLGGTRVMGLTVTMDAEQGLELLQTVRPELAVPIHYNDYEAFKSPLSDFQELVREAGLEASVAYVTHGDVLPISSRAGTTGGTA
jgi:L-ascorbate metabolism protein UlaG (beta-lactamase superfamily)